MRPGDPGATSSLCPHPRPGGGRCRSRKCDVCGQLWAGDTRVRLLANINAYGGDVALITITAPGADVLPWADDSRCTVVPAARYRWNRSAPDRWRTLHQRSAQHVRRRAGAFTVLAREWEYQRRGVLHMHVVVGMATPIERHRAHLYVQALDRRRELHGFGYVDRGKRGRDRKRTLEVVPAGHAAAYLAKYLAPSGAGKKALSETVREPDVPRLVVYVSRGLTGKTGVTMRNLRIRRLAFVLARERALAYETVLEALLGGVRPSVQLLYGNDDARTAELLAGIPPP
jgi:hypothetical protein